MTGPSTGTVHTLFISLLELSMQWASMSFEREVLLTQAREKKLSFMTDKDTVSVDRQTCAEFWKVINKILGKTLSAC